MARFTCSRRQFVVLSAGAAAGAIVLAACGPGTGPGAGADTTAGTTSDLKVGAARVSSDSSAVVMRDAGGLYAMSLTCTHSGCNMSDGVSAQSIHCSCHGSTFDLAGSVLNGPAQQALPHYAVTVDASGTITVHTDQTVASDVRTAV